MLCIPSRIHLFRQVFEQFLQEDEAAWLADAVADDPAVSINPEPAFSTSRPSFNGDPIDNNPASDVTKPDRDVDKIVKLPPGIVPDAWAPLAVMLDPRPPFFSHHAPPVANSPAQAA